VGDNRGQDWHTRLVGTWFPLRRDIEVIPDEPPALLPLARFGGFE